MQHCLLRHKNSLKDFDLYEIWDRLLGSGTAKTLFYDGSVNTHHEFRDFMRQDGNQMFAAYFDGKPAGVVWMNDMHAHNARVHGAYYRETWGRKGEELPKSIMLGRYTMATLLRSFPFDVLYGTIPVWNKTAIKFSVRCGAKPVGVVPHGAWMADKGESVDAMMLATTRESTEETWTKY